MLDPSLAPEGRHILHIFTVSSMDDWLVKLWLSLFNFDSILSFSMFFSWLSSDHSNFWDKFVLSQGLSPEDYKKKKEHIADEIIGRLEKKLFPGLKSSIMLKEVLLKIDQLPLMLEFRALIVTEMNSNCALLLLFIALFTRSLNWCMAKSQSYLFIC